MLEVIECVAVCAWVLVPVALEIADSVGPFESVGALGDWLLGRVCGEVTK